MYLYMRLYYIVMIHNLTILDNGYAVLGKDILLEDFREGMSDKRDWVQFL